MRSIRLPQWIDLLFIVALGIYAFGGMTTAPFHGDEAMQIYAASDYFTLMVDGAPERLLTQPPYEVDSDAHLRILNGSINRYAIGLVWQISGNTRTDLPPRPGWQWALSYEDNATLGYVPSDHTLAVTRIPSTFFQVVSIALVYLFTRAVGGRELAYLAALIYALHPALLLNGRRALQESAMICFGLFSLWCAARLASERPAVTGFSRTLLWSLLALACGITVASKHSGIVFAAASIGWVFIAGVAAVMSSETKTTALQHVVRLIVSIVMVIGLALGLFVAVSPALWNAPMSRLGDLVTVRSDLLASQVIAAGEAATLGNRLQALISKPFVSALQIYEAPTFIGSAVDVEAAEYQVSGLAGIPTANLLGVFLTSSALLGTATLLMPRLRSMARSDAWGILLTLGIFSASLLANPLPWQRYYLPLATLFCILSAVGIQTLMRAVRGFAPQSKA